MAEHGDYNDQYYGQNARQNRQNQRQDSEENIIKGVCPGCKKKANLILPCPCHKEYYCSYKCKERCFANHSPQCEKKGIEEDKLEFNTRSARGLCGLQNLGYTCYMNTAIQCLGNCWELTNYFLSDNYLKDINLNNPLGSSGQICRIYANILKHIWFGIKKDYIPRNFKQVLSNVNELFSGMREQDTHEFLGYLIDGLHEDLNRCKVKSNSIAEDDPSKPEYIRSLDNWNNFLGRNQSILVELFYGQFQHRTYCPNKQCQNIITRYEPYFSISLPLAAKYVKLKILCYFIFYDIRNIPLKIELQFYADKTIMALRNKVASLLQIHPFSFLVCKMDFYGCLYSIVNSRQSLSIGASYEENDNRFPFFLVQFDPKVFYEPRNNRFITNENKTKYKTKDYENLCRKILCDVKTKNIP